MPFLTLPLVSASPEDHAGGSGGSNQMPARVQNRGWVGGDVGVTKGSMSLSSGEEKTVLRHGQALHLLPRRSSTGA